MRSWRPSCAASAKLVRSCPGLGLRNAVPATRAAPPAGPPGAALDDMLEQAAPLESPLTRANEPARGDAVRSARGCPALQPLGRNPRRMDSSDDPARVVTALTCELPDVLRPRGADLRSRFETIFDRRAPDLGVACTRPRTGSTSSGDRVRSPRPQGRPRLEPGARAHFHRSSRLVDDDNDGELNDHVTAKISAIVLIAELLRAAPSSRGRSTSRVRVTHRRDVRHAEMFGRISAQGDDESLLPQQFANYEFELCASSGSSARRVASLRAHVRFASRTGCPGRSPSTRCPRGRRACHDRPARLRPGAGLRRSPSCTTLRTGWSGHASCALSWDSTRRSSGSGARPVLGTPTRPERLSPRGRPRARCPRNRERRSARSRRHDARVTQREGARKRTSFAASEYEQVDRCGSTPARRRSRHRRRDALRSARTRVPCARGLPTSVTCNGAVDPKVSCGESRIVQVPRNVRGDTSLN